MQLSKERYCSFHSTTHFPRLLFPRQSIRKRANSESHSRKPSNCQRESFQRGARTERRRSGPATGGGRRRGESHGEHGRRSTIPVKNPRNGCHSGGGHRRHCRRRSRKTEQETRALGGGEEPTRGRTAPNLRGRS